MKSTEQLLDDYYRFLSKSYQVNQLEDDSREIITPFTDNIGDNITIYLSQINNGKIQLDDDGYTLNNLEMLGINLSDARQQIMDQVLNQYDVTLNGDILLATGDQADFSRMKLNLTSAMIKIGDLSFTQRSHVKRMFVDDVIAAFNERELGGISSSFIGRSGVDYKFPYVVPNRPSHSMKVVDIINGISRDRMMQLAYKVNDVQQNATFEYALQPTFMVVYNDRVANINESASKIADDIGIVPYRFSDLDQIEKVLTA